MQFTVFQEDQRVIRTAKEAFEALNLCPKSSKRTVPSSENQVDQNEVPSSSVNQSSENEWSPDSDDIFSDSDEPLESDGAKDESNDHRFSDRNKPLEVDEGAKDNSTFNGFIEPDSTTGPVSLVTQEDTRDMVCPDSSDSERPSSPVIPYLHETIKRKKTVVGGHNLSDTKNKYNKHHSCLYCKKMYVKISRHLEQVHKSEREVVLALSLKKGSRERRKQWDEIVKRGDFVHNQRVMKEGEGYLIPKKRPKKEDDVFNYVTCDQCLGLYEKKLFYKHSKRCKPDQKSRNQNLLITPISTDPGFNIHILSSMTSDQVSFTVKQDPLILQFGSTMFKKSRSLNHQFQYIKQKMRELGKFLLEMRKVSDEFEALTLAECITPNMFSTALTAVKAVSKFDVNANGYGVPSLALKIGHSLRKCANLLKSQAIQAGDDGARKNANDFIELYTSDWCHEISSVALQTLHNQQFNNPKRIPLASDVRKLNQRVEDISASSEKELRISPNPSVWKKLAESTLAQVVLFNRRRGGETERMETEQYLRGVLIGKTSQEEILQSLTPFEQRLIETMERIEIRGKRGRRVPVLLPQNIKKRIDALIHFREASSVDSNNKYVFARQHSQLPIRSSDVLRKFAGACNASRPELLTSTSLRKHVATISQILNLKRNDLDSLANFLGHDINVHRNFYRLPEDTVQVAKVGKLLLELEKGEISKYKGLSLDEINIEDDTIVPDEDDGDDIEDGKDEKNKHIDINDTPTVSNCSPLEPSKSNINTVKSPSKKPVSRKPWSSNEKSAVENQLGRFFALHRLPGKHEVEEAQRREPVLRNRPWAQIKYFIKNMKSKKSSK